jgi:hypothetical protein
VEFDAAGEKSSRRQSVGSEAVTRKEWQTQARRATRSGGRSAKIASRSGCGSSASPFLPLLFQLLRLLCQSILIFERETA